MLSTNEVLSDGEMTIKLSGRVDAANAAGLEREILEKIGASSLRSLVFDLEDLEFIASAGLRVILRIRKSYPMLRIVNAGPEVYEVLRMTGFTEMMPVEKALKRIGIEGCELIGTGAAGRVYRLDPDTIVKYYYKKDALEEIKREREFARKAFVLGIPTAISYDVVRIGDGYGAVFELLNADTFVNLIVRDPEKLETYTERMVKVLRQFHKTKVKPGEFPNRKETGILQAKKAARFLPEPEGGKLVKLFEEMKDDDTLLHGDFHVKNVMLQKDEVLLIDMDTLCRGNAVFEFAAMYNAYIAYGDLNRNNSMEFFGIPFKTAKFLFERTLALYLGSGEGEAYLNAYKKAALVGYTEMTECFAEEDENSPETRYYAERLTELVRETESISF